jgi:hypothetical protein
MPKLRGWLAASACLFVIARAPHVAAESSAAPGAGMQARKAMLAAVPALRANPAAIRLPSFLGLGGTGSPGALKVAPSQSVRSIECGKQCTQGRTNRTLSTTSTVLAGVAAVGISAGIVLLLSNPRRSEQSVLVPTLRVRLSTEKAFAGAVWKF